MSYISDYSVVDERKIVTDEEKYIIDVTVFDKKDYIEKLEGYLEEYMK